MSIAGRLSRRIREPISCMWQHKGVVFAVIAMGVSVAAVGFQIAAWHTQREHDRLSVMPVIGFSRILSPLASFPLMGLYMESCGLGPAKLIDATVQMPPTQQEFYELTGPTLGSGRPFEMLAHLVREKYEGFPDIHYMRGIPAFLPAGESACLFGIAPTADATSISILSDIIYGLRVTIIYESLYGEESTQILEPLSDGPES